MTIKTIVLNTFFILTNIDNLFCIEPSIYFKIDNNYCGNCQSTMNKQVINGLELFSGFISYLSNTNENMKINSKTSKSSQKYINTLFSQKDIDILNDFDKWIYYVFNNDNYYQFKHLIIKSFRTEYSDKKVVNEIIIHLLKYIVRHSMIDKISIFNNKTYSPYIINIIHSNYYKTVVNNLKETINEPSECLPNFDKLKDFFNCANDNENNIDNIIKNQFRRKYIENNVLTNQNDLNQSRTINIDYAVNCAILSNNKDNYLNYCNNSFKSFNEVLENERKNNICLNYRNKIDYSNYKEKLEDIKELINEGYITNPTIIALLYRMKSSI